MSKIFEALENATHGGRRTRSLSMDGPAGLGSPLVVPVPPLEPPSPPGRSGGPGTARMATANTREAAPVAPAFRDVLPHASPKMEQEMLRLYVRIQRILHDPDSRVLQFISSRSGEGTSAIAAEFAAAAARYFGKRVLLLEVSGDAEGTTPRRDSTPSVPGASGALHVATVAPDAAAEALAQMRDSYDLVLVDCPAATRSPTALAISKLTDGVVLIVEAEATRTPVAQHVKRSIEQAGGRVIGIVLNKQRYHIPPFIYRRL